VSEQSDLLGAVQHLSRVVKALDDRLARDYPKWADVERDFLTKVQGKKRVQLFALAAVVSTILSFFVTVSSVNYCFLNGVPEPGDRDICQVFPGWEESFESNRRFVDEFTKLQAQIEDSQVRLQKLEGK
jgi:hypothetical protein